MLILYSNCINFKKSSRNARNYVERENSQKKLENSPANKKIHSLMVLSFLLFLLGKFLEKKNH